MFVAFTLMWACTPSSLRKESTKGVTKAADALPIPDEVPLDEVKAVMPDAVAQIKPVADTLLAKADSLIAKADTLIAKVKTIAEQVDTAAVKTAVKTAGELQPTDIPAVADSLMQKVTDVAAAKVKRDTTTMDSLELAIYKYNKVIDDSLARDSMNRAKKNGIDAPVKYTASDSLTYEAATGRAHLYGDSHVEYQNMDLKSEKIYMVLDSSLVHATGIRDSASGGLKGTPVFKMGSDTYENDTMAFNFKTKKGLITQVYTQQEDGFLTSEIAKRGANGESLVRLTWWCATCPCR